MTTASPDDALGRSMPERGMLPADRRAELRSHHRKVRYPYGDTVYCGTCKIKWPCDAITLLAAYDHAIARLDALAAAVLRHDDGAAILADAMGDAE